LLLPVALTLSISYDLTSVTDPTVSPIDT